MSHADIPLLLLVPSPNEWKNWAPLLFCHFGACRKCSFRSLILTLLLKKTCSFSRCQLNDARFARVFLLCGGISKGRTKKCTWNWSQDTCLGASLFSICLGMPIMSIWKRQVIHRPLASTNWANCCCFWFCLHIARTPQGAQGFHAVTGDTHKSSKIFPTSQPPPSSPPFTPSSARVEKLGVRCK